MKKILAMVLAMMLVLSMSAAFAEGEGVTYTDMTTVTVTKTYKLTNAGTISPAETFTFSKLTCTEVKDAGVGVTTTNAPVPTIASVGYAAGEAGSATATKNITITLPEYTAVGIYTYTFTEVDGGTAGVTYRPTSDVITLVVTVIEQNGKVRVAAVHTEDTTAEKAVKSDDFDNEYSAGSLSVGKTVTGVLGDKKKDFSVTVTFTAPAGDTVREAIKYTDDGEEKTIAADWNNTVSATIDLKDTETVTFTNIPYGVTYTVVEADYTDEGYDAANYVFDDSAKKIDSASENVQITNNKDGSIDTGISLDNAPYMILMALVVIAGAALIVKRASANR